MYKFRIALNFFYHLFLLSQTVLQLELNGRSIYDEYHFNHYELQFHRIDYRILVALVYVAQNDVIGLFDSFVHSFIHSLFILGILIEKIGKMKK